MGSQENDGSFGGFQVEIIKTVEHDRAHVKCQNLNKSVVPCFTDKKKNESITKTGNMSYN